MKGQTSTKCCDAYFFSLNLYYYDVDMNERHYTRSHETHNNNHNINKAFIENLCTFCMCDEEIR